MVCAPIAFEHDMLQYMPFSMTVFCSFVSVVVDAHKVVTKECTVMYTKASGSRYTGMGRLHNYYVIRANFSGTILSQCSLYPHVSSSGVDCFTNCIKRSAYLTQDYGSHILP